MSVLDRCIYWIVNYRLMMLQNRVIEKQDKSSLCNLIDFAMIYKFSLPVHQATFRSVIVASVDWNLEYQQQRYLFNNLETYLFGQVEDSKPAEWDTWLKGAHAANYQINVRSERTRIAIFNAFRSGVLHDLSGEATNILCNLYVAAYPNRFKKLGLTPIDATPVLIEYPIQSKKLTKTALHEWLQNRVEQIWKRRFVGRPGIHSWLELNHFLAESKRPVPIGDNRVPDALINLDIEQIEKSYAEPYLFWIEQYLFYGADSSYPEYWKRWVQIARTNKEINKVVFFDKQIVVRLQKAYESGELALFTNLDYEYLVRCFSAEYREFVASDDSLDSQYALRALAEFSSDEFKQALPMILVCIHSLQENELADRILKHHQQTLENIFVTSADLEALTQLLRFVINCDREFPIDNPQVQTTLFALNTWQVADELRGVLFDCIEGFLFNNMSHPNKAMWHKWLNQCRIAHRPIRVTSPVVANALVEAYNGKMLVNLPHRDHLYLLQCYREEYGDLLAKSGSTDIEEALPILLELATVTHVIGADESYDSILEPWVQQDPHCPRSLASLTEIQSYQAPIFGIGSPHRTSVTIVRDLASSAPVQIVSAGTTGDATMNARIFNQLFASALACNSEPTLLTTNGSVLSLQPHDSILIQAPPEELRSVVIGPAGPVPPTPDMPTLGMSAEDAMLLMQGSFEQDQKITDLVRVENAQQDLIAEFERRIRNALNQDNGRIFEVEIDDIRPSEAGIITAIPLLHRDSGGNIVPVEIEVPYSVLGAEQIFTLLQSTRTGYIKQLITGVERRQRFAEDQVQQLERRINWWNNPKNERERERELLRQPIVYATIETDYQTGTIKKLATPIPYDREDYETEVTKGNRDHAQSMAERFFILSEKLKEIDKPYGLADSLSFKLLVDAMVRKSNLPIPHIGFQGQYKEWIRISQVPVWALIKQWAKKRGLPPQIFAADNILFNSRLRLDPERVIIQPWALIDLHSGTVQIDQSLGLTLVTGGNMAPTLHEAIQSTGDYVKEDPAQLHKDFRDWFKGLVDLPVAPDKRIEMIESQIRDRNELYPLVMLEWAKSNLLEGHIEAAIETLDALHQYDMAPTYFWLAVAHQYRFIEQHPESLGESVDIYALEYKKRHNAIYDLSIWGVIDQLWLDNSYWNLGKDATETIEILRKKDILYPITNYGPVNVDSEFRRNVLQQISTWETFNLPIAPNQRTEVNAIVKVLRAASFLSLAEEAQLAAKTLPFSGGMPSSSRDNIDNTLEKLCKINFGDENLTTQIEALSARYNGIKSESTDPAYKRTGSHSGIPTPIYLEQRTSASEPFSPQQIIYKKIPNGFKNVIDNVSEILRECCSDMLLNHYELKNAFIANGRLKQWASGLVETQTEDSRLNRLIEYLFWIKDGDENGLVVFLNEISASDDHDCRNRIQNTAKSLADHLATDLLMSIVPYNALDTSRHLVQNFSIGQTFQDRENNLDVWDMAAVKRHLHIISESIAGIVQGYSDAALSYLKDKRLTFLLSLAVDLHWQRGYLLALNRIEKLPLLQRPLAELCELIEQECTVRDGILSTGKTESGDMMIELDSQPAVLVKRSELIDPQVVYASVNNLKFLPPTENEDGPLKDRIGQIPITITEAKDYSIGKFIHQNRDALIPLIARHGIPEAAWLLSNDENYPPIGNSLQ